MRMLVACEYSGTVRDAFENLGWDAWSCDILPTESEQTKAAGKHIQGNIMEILNDEWDLIIAHPPCTRLANSGVRWLKERNLWDDLNEAIKFFNVFRIHAMRTGIPTAIENPIPHKYASACIGDYTQIIQPWQFGYGETKATCLWLYGLPQLWPTEIVEGREPKMWRMPPGADRAKERSKTYPGFAKAMAEQWTEYFLKR